MQTNRVSTDENNMAIHYVAANAVHMTLKKQLSEALSRAHYKTIFSE